MTETDCTACEGTSGGVHTHAAPEPTDDQLRTQTLELLAVMWWQIPLAWLDAWRLLALDYWHDWTCHQDPCQHDTPRPWIGA